MNMDPATVITVSVLALVLVLAILCWLGGEVTAAMRAKEREGRAASEAFDQGADTDAKMRKLGERARRLGR